LPATKPTHAAIDCKTADTLPFPICTPVPYNCPMKTWMRHRGDRVTITTGKYGGHTGTVESNVYQRTVDYPDEFASSYHVMLDTEELVTIRWDQVVEVK